MFGISVALLGALAVVLGQSSGVEAGPPADEAPPAVKDPRRQALTTVDALFVVKNVAPYDVRRARSATGTRIRRIADLDGDGIDDLAVLRSKGGVPRIDAVSTRDGREVRALWNGSESKAIEWNAGGDLDGDGLSDVLVAREFDGRALVEAVSGRTGEVLRSHVGERGTLSFVDDIDGDGCSEYLTTTEANGLRLRSGKSGVLLWEHARPPGSFPFGHVEVVGDFDADGVGDLVSHGEAVELLRARTGEVLRVLRRRVHGCSRESPGPALWCGAGDVDADGVDDLFLREAPGGDGYQCTVRVVSGRTFRGLFDVRYPSVIGEYTAVACAGDIDGDGHADLLVSEGNFNLGEYGTETPAERERQTRKLQSTSLRDALTYESSPYMAGNWESGCALVYSGKDERVLAGIWGLPYSRDGLGMEVLGLPDVTGDGLPDLLVADSDRAYAFAGARAR